MDYNEQPGTTAIETADKPESGLNAFLKSRYRAILERNWPLNRDPGKATNEDAAYYLSLERIFVNSKNDQPLAFPKIKDKIQPPHLSRIEEAWNLVRTNATDFYAQYNSMHAHWKNAPEFSTEEKERLIQETAAELQPEYQDSPNEALRTIEGIIEAIRKSLEDGNAIYPNAQIADLTRKKLDTPPLGDEDPFAITEKNPINEWKVADRSFRKTFYHSHKEYLVTLRTYYELLLEKKEDPNTKSKEYVLTPDTDEKKQLRNDIAIANRYLRLIDTVTQALSAAKIGHHEQPKGRFRKTKLEAYIRHELEVVFSIIRNVIPYVIEQQKLPTTIDVNILIILAALHDLLEDSSLTMDTIEEKIKNLADNYDSSLLGKIRGGFGIGSDGKPGLDAKGICREYLDLIGKGDAENIRSTLRILSKNSELDEDEKINASKQGICSKSLIVKFLGITEAQSKRWHFGKNPTHTFQQFPQEHDGSKLTQFLIRLNAIKGPAVVRQYALMVKNSDRAKNIEDSEKMKVEKQFETLRETTTRLIAWQMLDHNHSRRPVYNTLPNLIDTTIEAYGRLAFQHTDKFTEKDNQYLQQLSAWRTELKTRGLVHEEPESVSNPVEKWRTATHNNAMAEFATALSA